MGAVVATTGKVRGAGGDGRRGSDSDSDAVFLPGVITPPAKQSGARRRRNVAPHLQDHDRDAAVEEWCVRVCTLS